MLKMNKDELEAAKIMHKLSVDHQFAKKQFNKLIKKYEKTKVLCGKYFFGLWIDVYIPDTLNKNYKQEKFAFDRLSASFLSSDQDKMSQAELNTFSELNLLTIEEKNDITKKYLNLIEYKNTTDINYEYLYIIPNLIKLFYKKGYEFLLIPTTVDFNTDVGLVHQCLILVDFKKGIVLFYEPYLSYTKYEHDYSYPIGELFQIYNNSLPAHFINNKTVNFKNYTDYLGISQHEGIQNIILNKNNNKKSEFESVYSELMLKIQNNIPNLYDKIKFVQENDKNPVNQTDNTIKILDVIYYFEKWKLQDRFPEIYEEILYIYGQYNSKSCVSLTLIEINYLFQEGNPKQGGNNLNSVKNLHEEIKNSNMSNKIILERLFLFINSK